MSCSHEARTGLLGALAVAEGSEKRIVIIASMGYPDGSKEFGATAIGTASRTGRMNDSP
jgi:hypothetical protein